MNKIRILQCIYSMDRGGVETWLMQVLRRLDQQRYRIDFLTHTRQPGDYDDEIKKLGSRILTCCHPRHIWRYPRELKKLLQQYGPYDVVHSHSPNWNGPVMKLTRDLGIPVRIVHCHNDPRSSLPDSIIKRLYLKWHIKRSCRDATAGLACSALAAASYFGENWREDSRWRIFFCGQDFSDYHKPLDPVAIRKQLGLPDDALVIGHVGNFRAEKNHPFLIKIFSATLKMNQRIRLLLVGGGELYDDIKRRVSRADLDDKVIFAGSRSDVPALLRAAMDVFVFPSLSEGLGLAAVEAQAAGLPCVISDVIPPEVDVVPQLIQRLSLSLAPETWANVAISAAGGKTPISKAEALAAVEATDFNLEKRFGELEQLYAGAVIK